MTLTLSGRLQTRVLLVLLVGVAWTAIITPFLPQPGEMTLTTAYRMTLTNLGLMAVTGLAWEFVYHMLQQLRWDKDWPSLLALLTVVNEGVAVWLVGHALQLVRGPLGPSSPMLPSFAVHFVTAYVAIWAVMQGPLRVLLIRWRFVGGHVVDPMARSEASRDDSSPSADTPPAITQGPVEDAGTADGPLVDGILCPERHFNHPRARYCAICGTSLREGGHGRVRAPRPPLGILIADDGTTRVVDGDIAVVPEQDALRLELVDGDAPVSCPLLIRLREWQCVAVSADRCVVASLPDGRQLLIEPHSSLPLLPGMELAIDGCRILFESPHQSTVRLTDVLDERHGLPPADEFGVRARHAAARLVAYLTTFAAMVLAIHVVLVVFGGNPSSVITIGVRRLAAALSPGFRDLFTPDTRLRVILNDGLAAAVYLLAGYFVAKLPRRNRADDE